MDKDVDSDTLPTATTTATDRWGDWDCAVYQLILYRNPVIEPQSELFSLVQDNIAVSCYEIYLQIFI